MSGCDQTLLSCQPVIKDPQLTIILPSAGDRVEGGDGEGGDRVEGDGGEGGDGERVKKEEGGVKVPANGRAEITVRLTAV